MKSSSIVLPPLSALYGAIVKARLGAYQRGIISRSRLPVPVISVGNITAGGTGKTPMVAWICRVLRAAGSQPCVLTRGYQRDSSKRVLVSDGKTVLATLREAGDEALLLARELKGVAAVVCDANRVTAGEWAQAELKADVFVLDDGFQHLQLERDLNLLLIDASDPWGGGKLLPSGRLREPLEQIKRADAVVLTRVDDLMQGAELVDQVKALVDCPVITSTMRVKGFLALSNGSDSKPDEPVAAFCGVGNPGSFFRQLEKLGFIPVLQKPFRDHHDYTQADINQICRDAQNRGARALITTAKDAVKLEQFDFKLPVHALKIEVELHQPPELVELIHQTINRQ